MPTTQFLSEPLTPVQGTMDVAAAATGEPALPRAFQWRSERLEIEAVLELWKESAPCPFSRGAERYLRKHWYRLRTTTGRTVTIYFERQARSASQRKKRWWLYTME